MPHTPLAGNTVTGTRDQAGTRTHASAPVTAVHDFRKAQAPVPRCVVRDPPAAPPSTVGTDTTAGAPAEVRRGRMRGVAGLLRRARKTTATYHDPLFELPELIEDDYYRLRNLPPS